MAPLATVRMRTQYVLAPIWSTANDTFVEITGFLIDKMEVLKKLLNEKPLANGVMPR